MNITNIVNFTPMKKVSYLKEVHVQGSFVVDTKWRSCDGWLMGKNDIHTKGRLSVLLGSILAECL